MFRLGQFHFRTVFLLVFLSGFLEQTGSGILQYPRQIGAHFLIGREIPFVDLVVKNMTFEKRDFLQFFPRSLGPNYHIFEVLQILEVF